MSQGITQGWSFSTEHFSPTSLLVEVTNLEEAARTLTFAGAVVRESGEQGALSIKSVTVEGLSTVDVFIELPKTLTTFKHDATLRLYFKSAGAS